MNEVTVNIALTEYERLITKPEKSTVYVKRLWTNNPNIIWFVIHLMDVVGVSTKQTYKE